jgi:hypothetical protein
MQLAGVLEDNTRMKSKITELESVEGEKCPKCRKQGWQLVGSHRDSIFGEAGGRRRTYNSIYADSRKTGS